MIDSITLLGSSSGRNAGDAALIAGLMAAVDEMCGRRILYEIPTIRPSYIREHYPNRTHPVSMMPWHLSLKMLGLPTWRSMMRTDLTLLFDAILFDRELFNPLFNFMSSLYVMLPPVKRHGKILGCYDIGVGPVSTRPGRHMLKKLLELMDFVTVRDRASLRIMQELGVRNNRVLLGADAALDVCPAPAEVVERVIAEKGLNGERPLLAVNINRYFDSWAEGSRHLGEKVLDIYAEGLSRALQEIGTDVAFVCTQHMDVEVTRRLMSMVRLPGKGALLSNQDYDHYVIKGILGRADMVCAMRLHCAIMAAGELTPVVALEYQPKLAHFMETLELSEYCLSFSRFSEEALARLILEGWRNRKEIRKTLQRLVPGLKRRSRVPAVLVASLDRGDDVDTALAVARRYIEDETRGPGLRDAPSDQELRKGESPAAGC